MAKKQVIEQFGGERPRVKDEDLPQSAASLAINTRLSNGDIRAYPEIKDSTDENSVLSNLVTGGYTNFFKASSETAINWMSWITNTKVSILETRYNNIQAYEFPLPPTTNVQPGETLAVGFSGQFVSNQGAGSEDWRAAFTNVASTGTIATGTAYPFDQDVSATVVQELDTITSYLWQYVSGDGTIVITNDTSETANFATTLEYPPQAGIGNGLSKSATYRCTVTDASGNTGTKDIIVSFTTVLFDPPPRDDGGFDIRIFNDLE